MGWNGSDLKGTAQVESQPKAAKPSLARGIVAGLAVVLIAVGAAWFLFFNDSTEPAQDVERKADKTISEVKPARTKRPAEIPIAKPRVKPRNAEEAIANVAPLAKPEMAIRKLTPEEWDRLTNRTFSTGTEQLIGWVCSVTPGDMPIPIPSIGDEEKKDIIAILLSKNKVKETDSEKIANLKMDVDYAKREMMQYLKEGGDPDDFLQYYFRELNACFQYRNQCLEELNAIYDDGDVQLARDFRKRVNELLTEKGIKTIPLSEVDDEAEEEVITNE